MISQKPLSQIKELIVKVSQPFQLLIIVPILLDKVTQILQAQLILKNKIKEEQQLFYHMSKTSQILKIFSINNRIYLM
jgi:hypothetical protein